MLSHIILAILLIAGHAAAQNSTYPLTTDGNCGTNGRMCLANGTSPCCSADNFGGNTDNYCNKASGCQDAYGACHANPASLDNPPCSWADEGTSPRCDGTCGSGHHNALCANDTAADAFVAYGVYNYGPCCSSGGFCGSTPDHCMVERHCQSGCWQNGSSTASSSASAATGSASAAEKVGVSVSAGAGLVLVGLVGTAGLMLGL